MFILDGEIIYSATDLAAASRCEFAVLRDLDGKLRPEDAPPREVDDPVLARAAALGLQHEARWLEELRSEGRDIVTIEQPARDRHRTRDVLVAKHQETIAALRDEVDVVYQGGFFHERFHGWADFLVRQPDGSYAVYDTKLARRAKVTAVLQLAAYGDQLERAGIAVSPSVHLVPGRGDVTHHPYAEIVPVYRRRRHRLESILDEHLLSGRNAAWDDERFSRCGRCAVCQVEVEASQDLLLVANVSSSQRSRLRAHGIRTVQELADRVDVVPGIAAATFDRLRAQAALQLESAPTVDMHHPEAVEHLPPPSPNDIFFDFEGDPLWVSPDDVKKDWGLEYLFGWVSADGDGELQFHHLVAHDRAAERRALETFIDVVDETRRTDPSMHVYHYAPYEVTALLRLAGRHQTREEKLDELIRQGVFVDLLKTVRETVRTSESSLGLKALETFFVDESSRDGVTSAAQSVAEYGVACVLRDAGDLDGFTAHMQRIIDYNAEDCRSTARLRDWLTGLADERGHRPKGKPRNAAKKRETQVVDAEVLTVADALETAARHPQRPADERKAYLMIAAALEFHRREERPFWREHHARLGSEPELWDDTRDTFVAGVCSSVDKPVVVVNAPGDAALGGTGPARRRLRLHGTAEPGSAVRTGGRVWTLYEPSAHGLPNGVQESAGAPRGWNGSECEIESIGIAACGCAEIVLLEGGPAAATTALPFAAVPVLVQSSSLKKALVALGRSVVDAGHDLPRSAATDLLCRREPRLVDGRRLHDRSSGAVDNVAALTRALLDCDDSYVAVQGPPGTGKTFTAAAVIARLVQEHGWRVGVVAQSHAVVENLLERVLDAGLDPGVVGKKRPKSASASPDPFSWLDETVRPKPGGVPFRDFYAQPGGVVFGGTAWDLVSAKRLPEAGFDLVVVDEAGQFSLANTLAVSGRARRLLLLGDPQQLPQVTQGTHPEPVDTSALGWIANGRRTLPPEYGFFLGRSWRMHPDLCAVDSELAYDGRLESAPVAGERSLDGTPAGLRTVLVHHSVENRTSSTEEAEAVVAVVSDLLNGVRLWRDPDEGVPRPLAERDVIVVAPYNAQVDAVRRLLSRAGFGAVKVGTVDKFQGQEAAVSIVTLAATSAAEVPRGVEFLLNRNRLNVAISRAKHHAVLIHSPGLYDYLPNRPDELAEFGAFVRLSTSGLARNKEMHG